VAARCPRLGYICRAHGFAAEPTLRLLISNPLDSRAPVASTLVEVYLGGTSQCSHPSRVWFFEPLARAVQGSHLIGKGPRH
jgi:hypothetical protein